MFLKIEVLLGLGIWLLLAALNNIFDSGTNQYLILNMVKMKGIKEEDSPLGKGLLSRAFKSQNKVIILVSLIAYYQFLYALALISSAVFFGYASFYYPELLSISESINNIVILFFNAIWLFFLSGGLWFGYWIKFFPAQTTHFILLLVGIMTAVLINIHV